MLTDFYAHNVYAGFPCVSVLIPSICAKLRSERCQTTKRLIDGANEQTKDDESWKGWKKVKHLDMSWAKSC